jgi:hypothetical protein
MPTIDIPGKICTHCGGTKWKIEYEKRPYWIRTRYRCAKQAQERCNRWALKNPEKLKEIYKNQKKDYKTSSYRKKQLEKYHYNKDNLTDRFIKHRIAHMNELSQSDIPQELIELKRKQLLLIRQNKNNG